MKNEIICLKGKDARSKLKELQSPSEQPRKNVKFFIKDRPFIVQAYKPDEFVNFVPEGNTEALREALYNVRVDFIAREISTDGKPTAIMKEIINSLDIDRVEFKLLDVYQPFLDKWQNELSDCKCFGFFDNGKGVTAFDHRHGRCNVEDFETEPEALKWLYNL